MLGCGAQHTFRRCSLCWLICQRMRFLLAQRLQHYSNSVLCTNVLSNVSLDSCSIHQCWFNQILHHHVQLLGAAALHVATNMALVITCITATFFLSMTGKHRRRQGVQYAAKECFVDVIVHVKCYGGQGRYTQTWTTSK